MKNTNHNTLLSINLGRTLPLLAGGRKVLSGIGKRAVGGAVQVQRMGLVGDDVADLSVHGGLDKAVYARQSTTLFGKPHGASTG
jgi:MOSC domain-containing protein YiiM